MSKVCNEKQTTQRTQGPHLNTAACAVRAHVVLCATGAHVTGQASAQVKAHP